MKKVIYCLLATMLLVSLVLGCARAAAPTTLRIATNPTGTLFNMYGIGIGDVITKHTDMMVKISAMAGPTVWVPMMETGEADMGISTDYDMFTAYAGLELWTKQYKDLRLVSMGVPMLAAPLVRNDSDIRKITDLKGKKLPWGFAAFPAVQRNTKATLANAGVTEDDVVKVPCAGMPERDTLFREGKVDWEFSSVGDPEITEMNAVIKLRFVGFDSSPTALAAFQKIQPTSAFIPLKKGAYTAVLEDITVARSAVYWLARGELSNDAVYKATKAVWENYKELAPVHPNLAKWTPETMAGEVVIPFHDGAIKLYKEKGVWTKELEEMQKKLLAAK